ncbi:MAG: hypothetical protein A4E51_01086 [Methanosaeta sp. PtaU1.Bin055]|nr:MAG: hypothetical protein A4E51_01086 [Methanosaeta sp. PtaU1.Bin055]
MAKNRPFPSVVPVTPTTSSGTRLSTSSEPGTPFWNIAVTIPVGSSSSTTLFPLALVLTSITIPMTEISLPARSPRLRLSIGLAFSLPARISRIREYRSRKYRTKSWYSPTQVDLPVMSLRASRLEGAGDARVAGGTRRWRSSGAEEPGPKPRPGPMTSSSLEDPPPILGLGELGDPAPSSKGTGESPASGGVAP